MTFIRDYFAKKRSKMAHKRLRIRQMARLDKIAKTSTGANSEPRSTQLIGRRQLDHALIGTKSYSGMLSTFVLIRAKYRNGGYCEVPFDGGCKNPATLLYHINPRGRWGTRYDPRYIIAGCNPHNSREHWHRDTERDLWKEHMGAAAFELMIWIGKNFHPDVRDIYDRVKSVLAGGRDHEYVLNEKCTS